jgi:hypothetical protein
VWADLREEIEIELAMLREHLDGFSPLRKAVAVRAPDRVETAALASVLHAFYNGVENIFKRIAVRCEGGIPEGATWHQQLLSSMAGPVALVPR